MNRSSCIPSIHEQYEQHPRGAVPGHTRHNATTVQSDRPGRQHRLHQQPVGALPSTTFTPPYNVTAPVTLFVAVFADASTFIDIQSSGVGGSPTGSFGYTSTSALPGTVTPTGTINQFFAEVQICVPSYVNPYVFQACPTGTTTTESEQLAPYTRAYHR